MRLKQLIEDNPELMEDLEKKIKKSCPRADGAKVLEEKEG